MAKEEIRHIDFTKFTKDELVAICDRYRKYLEYNICRTYKTRRVDVDSKLILDDLLSGMNWNQLRVKYDLDVVSLKLRVQHELGNIPMSEVIRLKEIMSNEKIKD